MLTRQMISGKKRKLRCNSCTTTISGIISYFSLINTRSLASPQTTMHRGVTNRIPCQKPTSHSCTLLCVSLSIPIFVLPVHPLFPNHPSSLCDYDKTAPLQYQSKATQRPGGSCVRATFEGTCSTKTKYCPTTRFLQCSTLTPSRGASRSPKKTFYVLLF